MVDYEVKSWLIKSPSDSNSVKHTLSSYNCLSVYIFLYTHYPKNNLGETLLTATVSKWFSSLYSCSFLYFPEFP